MHTKAALNIFGCPRALHKQSCFFSLKGCDLFDIGILLGFYFLFCRLELWLRNAITYLK